MRRLSRRLLSLLIAVSMVITMAFIPAEPVMAANASSAIAWGIDVSKHNGAINWAAVAQSGAKFAFVKAGSTNKGKDPFFEANMNGATNAGLRVGVYLYSYASNVEQAQAEANQLLEWMAPFTVSFPVVYDIENTAQARLTTAQRVEMVNAFCGIIAAAGYYPVVYSSKNWFEKKLNGVGFDKWIAQYNDHLDYEGAAFWQNSSHGSVSGVPTRVDTNYQFKDYSGIIIPDGLVDRDGGTRFYAGYKMQRNGWVSWAETRFHLDEAGFVQKQMWFQDESGMYYLQGDGSIARGQVCIGDTNYYFDANGNRISGWVALENGRFYYAPDTGVMVHGWVNDEAGRYYMSTADGHMLVGDVTIEGINYYFGDNGIMTIGLVQKADGQVYYYNEAGAMLVNTQIVLGEHTYNIDAKGVVTEVVPETVNEAGIPQ